MAPAMVIGPFHHPRPLALPSPQPERSRRLAVGLGSQRQQSVAQIGTLLVAEQVATNAGQAQDRDDPDLRDALDHSMVWIRTQEG